MTGLETAGCSHVRGALASHPGNALRQQHRRQRRFATTAAAAGEQVATTSSSSSSTGGEASSELKQQLRAALQGIDRGIFGTTAVKRQEVLSLVSQLESVNPIPQPLHHMDMMQGDWRLLYTTITITGIKKTKLGLREFVKLGDFIQRIDTQQHTAINEVGFSVTGFGKFKGRLAISASYAPAAAPHGASRVDISFLDASLTPEALEQLFKANYQLLLSIFNPEGWLEVTYLDEELRIGRDDKGNVFVVERAAEGGQA